MDKIQLIDTVPNVFQGSASLMSDIWAKEVTFEKGKLYLVEANSGTGKSSLCSYIYGYRHDYQGTILFDEENVRSYTIKQWNRIRKKHFSLLWQELRLFPELTALENVQIKNCLTRFQKKKQILEWFDMLGITEKLNAKVECLSYGQQQRVALVRALCQPFDFLLLDEPVSHLDDSNSEIMERVVMAEVKRQGAGVIATSIGKRIELPYDQVFNL